MAFEINPRYPGDLRFAGRCGLDWMLRLRGTDARHSRSVFLAMALAPSTADDRTTCVWHGLGEKRAGASGAGFVKAGGEGMNGAIRPDGLEVFEEAGPVGRIAFLAEFELAFE